jgi:hypothetical protein
MESNEVEFVSKVVMIWSGDRAPTGLIRPFVGCK